MWEGVMRLKPHSNFLHLLMDPVSFFFTITHDSAKMSRIRNAILQMVVNFIVKAW